VTIPLRLDTNWQAVVQTLVELRDRVPWKIPGKDALRLLLSDENPTFRNFIFARHSKKGTCLIKQWYKLCCQIPPSENSNNWRVNWILIRSRIIAMNSINSWLKTLSNIFLTIQTANGYVTDRHCTLRVKDSQLYWRKRILHIRVLRNHSMAENIDLRILIILWSPNVYLHCYFYSSLASPFISYRKRL